MFQPVVVPAGDEQTHARGNALMSNKHGNDKHVAKNALRTAWYCLIADFFCNGKFLQFHDDGKISKKHVSTEHFGLDTVRFGVGSH